MQDWGRQDRPREKLARQGAGALSDQDLVALLIGHGMRGQPAMRVAGAILAAAGGVPGLARLHRGQLVRLPGIGPVQAARVQAALELGRRSLVPVEDRRPQFRSPRDAADYLLPQYGSHPVERFGVVLLDRKYRSLSVRVVSVGSLDASLAHPREVFREAIASGAAALIAFHNHPSGDPTPSQDDVSLTRRLQQAGAIVGVELADHVILADARYCSLRELGLI